MARERVIALTLIFVIVVIVLVGPNLTGLATRVFRFQAFVAEAPIEYRPAHILMNSPVASNIGNVIDSSVDSYAVLAFPSGPFGCPSDEGFTRVGNVCRFQGSRSRPLRRDEPNADIRFSGWLMTTHVYNNIATNDAQFTPNATRVEFVASNYGVGCGVEGGRSRCNDPVKVYIFAELEAGVGWDCPNNLPQPTVWYYVGSCNIDSNRKVCSERFSTSAFPCVARPEVRRIILAREDKSTAYHDPAVHDIKLVSEYVCVGSGSRDASRASTDILTRPSGQKEEIRDACLNSRQVSERYCVESFGNRSIAATETINCSGSTQCQEGACVVTGAAARKFRLSN